MLDHEYRKIKSSLPHKNPHPRKKVKLPQKPTPSLPSDLKQVRISVVVSGSTGDSFADYLMEYKNTSRRFSMHSTSMTVNAIGIAAVKNAVSKLKEPCNLKIVSAYQLGFKASKHSPNRESMLVLLDMLKKHTWEEIFKPGFVNDMKSEIFKYEILEEIEV